MDPSYAPGSLPADRTSPWHGLRFRADLGPLRCEADSDRADEEEETVRGRLLSIRERTQGLFAPLCCISGDPNPTNWGMREDGTVVLFDWERFGKGSPSLDIAISMPGLPSPDGQFEYRMASRYLEHWTANYGEPLTTIESLAIDIRRAKVWSIVEFLGAYSEGRLPESAQATVTRLAEWMPHGVMMTDL
jgi:hypothetical protein